MNAFQFYQKCVAEIFWLPSEQFIGVDSYDSGINAYHIFFDNAHGKQFYFLELDEIKTIVRCIGKHFGKKSHSYIEWKSFLKDAQSNRYVDFIH